MTEMNTVQVGDLRDGEGEINLMDRMNIRPAEYEDYINSYTDPKRLKAFWRELIDETEDPTLSAHGRRGNFSMGRMIDSRLNQLNPMFNGDNESGQVNEILK